VIKYLKYLKHYYLLKQQEKTKGKRFGFRFKDRNVQINDWTTSTPFDPHYTYHTSWAARKLNKIQPDFHVDIGSDLRFCTLISAFISTTFYDYRPAHIHLSNFKSEHADLVNLHFSDDSIESLSCMHVVEHVGLGRYGDPIDYEGDLKAINELKRVIKPGGSLLFVVPTGKPKIMFNAHRIYSYNQIIECFKGFELMEFSLLPDIWTNGMVKNASADLANSQIYACGCYWFVKEM
jgi:SAM-dependent methyltransferase